MPGLRATIMYLTASRNIRDVLPFPAPLSSMIPVSLSQPVEPANSPEGEPLRLWIKGSSIASPREGTAEQ